MALFVRQDENRSQLQEKLAAELKDKLKSSQIQSADTKPVILENDHTTRPAGMLIIALIAIFIVVSAVLFFAVK